MAELPPEEIISPPEEIPTGLPEGEVEIQDVSVASDGTLQILIRHTYKGQDDSFAVYADPSPSEKDLEKFVEQRVKERREFLDSVLKEEEARRSKEQEVKDKMESLKRRGRFKVE